MALERERIIDVALALLDEGGIDNVTTRRIAERLKVQQPALYWHFRSKQDILDAIHTRIMTVEHHKRTPRRGETWQHFAADNARSFRQALLSHRDGARIHAGSKPGAADIAGLEAQLNVYLKAGFTADQGLHAGIAIGRYVVGCVLEEQADADRSFNPVDFLEEFVGYPVLHETIRRYSEAPGDGNDAAFEAGLAMILDGLERQRGTAASPPRPARKTKAAPGGAA